MGKVKSYDPAKIDFIYAGVSIKEFGSGTFIDVRRDNASFRDLKGCDGEVTRLASLDSRGSIVFSLLQTSRVNLILSGFKIGDDSIGQGGLPVLIRDKDGNDLVACAEAWILEYPQIAWSKGIELRRWTLRCNGLGILLGGTSK